VITADGALWFCETLTFHPRIVRFSPDGSVNELANFADEDTPWLAPIGSSVALRSILPNEMQEWTLHPDVKVVSATGEIAHLRTTALGCNMAQPLYFCLLARGEFRWLHKPSILGDDFVLGPDGNVWFADAWHSAVGRVTPAGRVRYFTRGLTRWNSGPQHLTVGPDGAVWFTEIRSRVGRIGMDGRITEFSAGIPHRSFLGGIVTGPDGNLWFTLYHGNELARITPRGDVRRFRRGIFPSRGNDDNTVDSVPFVDRSGNIWFNEPQGGRIARATIPR
jgi:streptogramin lyase